MTLSPPISVLAILGAALAVNVWLAPDPSLSRQVTVNLSAGAYDELANEARQRRTAEGSLITVSGIIEEKLFPSEIPSDRLAQTVFDARIAFKRGPR
jgi:hypothetical protein